MWFLTIENEFNSSTCSSLFVLKTSGFIRRCKLLSRRWVFRHRSWPWNECKCAATLPSKESPNSFQWSTIDRARKTLRKSKVHLKNFMPFQSTHPNFSDNFTVFVCNFINFQFFCVNINNFAWKVFVDSRTCGASGRSWTKRDASKNLVPKSTDETQEAIAKAWRQYG